MYKVMYKKIFWCVVFLNIVIFIIFNFSYDHLQRYIQQSFQTGYEHQMGRYDVHSSADKIALIKSSFTSEFHTSIFSKIMETTNADKLYKTSNWTKSHVLSHIRNTHKKIFLNNILFALILEKGNVTNNVTENTPSNLLPNEMNGMKTTLKISKNEEMNGTNEAKREENHEMVPENNRTAKFSDTTRDSMKVLTPKFPNSTINPYEEYRNKTPLKPHMPDDFSYYSNIITEKLTVKTNEPEQDYKNGTIQCPENPPKLIGKINVSMTQIPLQQLEKEYGWVLPGGSYNPPCVQTQMVAIIIPYRNRMNQLILFLQHMHPLLRKQQIKYTIFVTEQENDSLPFNKGQIMNTGFSEASKLGNFTCFIFHDVDLLPEDDRILYRCSKTARHLTASLDKWNYTLIYSELFGGVVTVAKDVFVLVNGYSNRFWGWGGEDDDFKQRMDSHKIIISRCSEFAKYKMIKHKKQKQNPNRYNLLNDNYKYFETDGLNNLNSTILKVDKYLLYTRILVRVAQNK